MTVNMLKENRATNIVTGTSPCTYPIVDLTYFKRKMKKYNTLVFMGRFQPVHLGHIEVIRQAMALCDQLIIIVGSANQPRTFKNPWNFTERSEMLRAAIATELNTAETKCEVVISSTYDTLYDDQAWAMRIEDIVFEHTVANASIGIIGHHKDASSFYLDLFPKWDLVEVENFENIDATNIRKDYFRNYTQDRALNDVPLSTVAFLQNWYDSNPYVYININNERAKAGVYKAQFEDLPFPPVFVTVDPIVLWNDKILLVQRKKFPSSGSWALPGGFFDADDTSIMSATVRELFEETSVALTEEELLDCAVSTRVFDAKSRSTRGRTLTHATLFLIKVAEDAPTPHVVGQPTEVMDVQWVPIEDLLGLEMFEDHYSIIQAMLGI